MDEADGKPGPVARQSGSLDALTDASSVFCAFPNSSIAPFINKISPTLQVEKNNGETL
jgi:hypothetical protein